MKRRATVEPFGESAFLVVFGGGIGRAVNARVHGFAAVIRAEAAAGIAWGHPVPAYDSVLVPFDPPVLDPGLAADRLAVLAERFEAAPAIEPDRRPIVEIPTRYGGTDGPDLEAVARRVGLASDRVVALHRRPTYIVYLLGFSPGFAYLGALPRALEVPRRDIPRTAVPAGSVAIAGRQTGVYPTTSPGGWNIIGRTEAGLWDARRDPPSLLAPGQRVRFVAIDR